MAGDSFWVDSYANNTGQGGARSNIKLAAGVAYKVTIDGNWSAWADDNHKSELWQVFTYGAGDFVEPKYHSFAAGRNLHHSQFNPEWYYASQNPMTPSHDHTGVVWKLTAGGAWVHNVEPDGGIGATWDATSHVYTYTLIGQGDYLWVATTDSNRFDNDGMLLVTIEGGGWVVGAVAAG